MIKKSIAFTLAESLLVMAVIGIVATLVVPNLKNNSDDQVYVAKARKVYSELETAYERATLKYGNPRDWTQDQTEAHLQAFLNVKKVCTEDTCTQEMLGCGKNYTILKDGSSYCVQRADIFNFVVIPFDVDGAQKGYNTDGKDCFNSFIHLNDGIRGNSVFLAHSPFVPGESDEAPTTANFLQWVLDYGNIDYNNCEVKWETKTSCK